MPRKGDRDPPFPHSLAPPPQLRILPWPYRSRASSFTMTDALHDLLTPYLAESAGPNAHASPVDAHTGPIAHHATPPPARPDAATAAYLARLTTLPLAALTSSEQQSLSQSAQASQRALQALTKRAHQPIMAATDRLRHVGPTVAHVAHEVTAVRAALPVLDAAAQRFSSKYNRDADNALIARRRKAMLLSRHMDRVADVLDLPTLLSSAITSSAAASAHYASALDLSAHIKRLHALYPRSPLINALAAQGEHEMQAMAANLAAALQSPNIKLAAAMRTVGWLRRVAPELAEASATKQSGLGSGEGTLGALFLVSRLAALESTFAALDPLRELADAETQKRQRSATIPDATWASGHQTEKYLKKYLEIFREQSFAIISMFKSIFPSALPAPGSDDSLLAVKAGDADTNALQPLPSALATFSSHLVDMLFDTLHTYMPNVQDRSTRDSLLTQVLYAAGSLGRLGGDFSMMIAVLEQDLQEQSDKDEEKQEEEWVQVMKKHRVQASRLELLASGVSAARITSPVR